MSTFQIIVLGIFGALVLLGVGVFATMGGLGNSNAVGNVVVWGTLPALTVNEALAEGDKDILGGVSYVYKNPATYEKDLVDAMASGKGPDLFLISTEEVTTFADKIIPIPYRYVSQGTFLNSFIDGAQQFLTPQGALALPFTIDPLVMYWNRDLFAGAGVATPPVYWNDFLELAPKITSYNVGSAVKKSSVALGEWRNVDHAKEILYTLFMQAGDRVVVRGSNGTPTSVFGENTARVNGAAESVVRFYTEFANPTKTSYSWNRSLPRSREAFIAGDLAVYFGLVSEGSSFVTRNPNLRFGVAEVPQIEGNSSKFTYGLLSGLAIARTARNPNGAVVVAQELSGPAVVAALVGTTGLPPVRRDVSVNTTANASVGIAIKSALYSWGFLDPNPLETSAAFQTMIESVISGANTPSEAVRDAAQELRSLMPSSR